MCRDVKRSPAGWLMAIGLAVIVSFMAVCAAVLWQMAQKDYQHAEEAATNLVASIASEIDRNIELYDLSLQAVVDGVKLPELEHVSPELRQVILFDRAATAKDLGSILVLDRDGNARFDSRSIRPGEANLADHDFFRVHQAEKDVGLFISRPWVTRSGEYLISLSRRISGPDGSFEGVVAGSMRLSYFHNLFRKLNFGVKDSMTLFDTNGVIIMRSPFEIDRIGQSISNSLTFQFFPQRKSGSYTAHSLLDDVTRLYVFKQVGNHPLLLTEGLSLEGIYADWRQQAWRIGVIMIALGVFSAFLIFHLVAALKRHAAAEDRLTLLARTDGLTGLANRRHFDNCLATEWRRGLRAQEPLSLLMIDVDYFKAYNDTHGHQAGDEVLAAVARCIAASTRRASDLGARYGGEEFAVLLPAVPSHGALEVAEAIRTRLAVARINRPDLPTVSIGLATLTPGPALAKSGLLKAADIALYVAKHSGRDRIHMSTCCGNKSDDTLAA